ncbi:hypothetical protein Pan110_35520 [Gimesia panareensis]|nr:hypothetical protein Pan110_35520 [Gimesia panareensis]
MRVMKREGSTRLEDHQNRKIRPPTPLCPVDFPARVRKRNQGFLIRTGRHQLR